MNLEKIIKEYTLRLEQMNTAIDQSASQYSKEENALKDHLQNHNALLGAKTESENVIALMNQAIEQEKASLVESNEEVSKA